MKFPVSLICLCLWCFGIAFCFADSPGPKIAILGDSITYDGKWPTLIEAGLRQNKACKDAQIVNFGVPSETTSGLSEPGHAGGAFPRPCLHERLGRILEQFKPNLVIACYGINDGIYAPLDADRFKAFKDGMAKLETDAGKSGAKLIIVTPPCYRIDQNPDDPYDKVLDAYSKWLVSQKQKGWLVVDMRPALKNAIAKEKKKNPSFIYASDGVHPGYEGHRMIAEAMWPGIAKILGFNATVDFPEGEDFQKLLQAHNANKAEWLIKTGHSRPQIPGYRPAGQVPLPPGHTADEWNSFPRHHFKVEGRSAFIVFPPKPADGKPWIWRTEFFGHEPQADIALIKNGFAAAYVDMQDMYGSPVSMKIMDAFYDYVRKTYGLSPKVTLEGFSRGGLFALNWAALHPECVASIYIDNPVCDFKSWPGGKGKSQGSPGDWEKLKKIYGFTEEQAMEYKHNPIDNLAPLAKHSIPILAVVKVDDTVVPVKENIDIVEKRYKKLGGKITSIRDPGDHHPHSLKDPTPIVKFILDATVVERKK